MDSLRSFRWWCRWKGLMIFSVAVMAMALVQFAGAAPILSPDIPENCNSEEGCCMPRPYTGAPVRQFAPAAAPHWQTRTRRPAHLLDDAEAARLERAYALQRALPDSDPRSFLNQAKLHCLYCDNGIYWPNSSWPLEIHGGWFFLPWHRMFLYFNERILAKLLDDDTFTLPYWNWDNQSPEAPLANTFPTVYSANTSSSLWNKNRNKCAEPPLIIELNTPGGCTIKTPSQLRLENDRITYTQIVSGATTSELFFGMPYRDGDAGGHGPGTFEDNPHGTVHLWVGDPGSPSGAYDDMGNFGRAARDPVFYAHHANVDRIWTVWKALPGEQRTEPTDPDFLNARFMFYDENGDLVLVNVSQVVDTASLGYNYEDSPMGWITNGKAAGEENNVPMCNPTIQADLDAMIEETPTFKPKMVLDATPLTFKVGRPRRRPANATEVLELQGLKLNPALQSHWQAYLYFPTASRNSSVACPEFVGTFNYVPHVGQPLFNRERVWRVAVGPKLTALQKENATDLIVTLAQFGPSIQPLQFGSARIFFDTSPATPEGG